MTLLALTAPLLFAAFVWWFSTGAILWLDRRPRETYGWSFAAASVIAAGALIALALSAGATSAVSAYVAFSAAIAVWGWHEMSFLMGFITGPRRQPLPAGTTGWRRFCLATATIIHHELALALTAVLIAALTWGQPNQIGVLTFLVLWALRLSAKLNLFLGAPYRAEDMLPQHLAHLKSYFRDKRMNALLPFSLAGGAVMAWAIGAQALAPDASMFIETGYLLVLTLTVLGLIEHVFLFLPPPNAMLWGWAGIKPPPRNAPLN
ncbi:MAG: putative photosynthetic complex assembly protein PuhE [Hyphomonadaceae bacterium]|nr:putative photosynthetic complex assembly protein PuhE [Hyphomonadaceae bacterium]